MIRKMVKNIRTLRKNQKGFTLIELMVVVVIIGIIVATALPQFNKATEKAKEKRAMAEIKNIKTVAMVIYAEDGTYPTSLGDMSDYNIPNPFPNPWGGTYSYSGGSSFTITDGMTPSKGITATPSSGP